MNAACLVELANFTTGVVTLDVCRFTYDEEDKTFYPEFKPEFDEYFMVDENQEKGLKIFHIGER